LASTIFMVGECLEMYAGNVSETLVHIPESSNVNMLCHHNFKAYKEFTVVM
jgi:hypothetical protein